MQDDAVFSPLISPHFDFELRDRKGPSSVSAALSLSLFSRNVDSTLRSLIKIRAIFPLSLEWGQFFVSTRGGIENIKGLLLTPAAKQIFGGQTGI